MENGIFQGDRIDTEKLKSLIKDIHISFRLNPETGRPDTYLNGVNVENKIRTMEVSSRVSPIATLDFVREAMVAPVSYTHLRAHETRHDLVCRLLLEKKKKTKEETDKTYTRKKE